MRTFQDSEGRTWELSVTVDAVKRVKALLGIDLLEAVEGRLLERLAADPVLLCDLVYAVCKPQADAQGIDDADFGRAMFGDAIDAATAALLEELVGFFPRRRRAVLHKVLAKLRTLEGMTLDAATRALEGDTLEKLLQAELDDHDLETFVRDRLAEARGSGGPSTTSPAPPASIPGR